MSLENSCTGGKIREFMDWTDRPVGRQSMIYLCRSDPSHFGFVILGVEKMLCLQSSTLD